MAILSFIQISAFIEGYSKENDGIKTTAQIFSFISAAAAIQRRFIEAGIDLTSVSTQQTLIYQKPLERIRTQITVLGAIGMFADAATAALEAYEREIKFDNDAATFYYISATAYSVGGGLTILNLASEYIWINPWIIFALAAIGF